MNREVIKRELRKIKIDAAAISSRVNRSEWDDIDIAGVAAIIASIYSGYESIFVNLCKNKVQKNEHWHKELLKNAIAEGIIPPEIESIMRDLLAFRHIQRNYYIHELIESEVRKKAVEILNLIIPTFDKHLQGFVNQ